MFFIVVIVHLFKRYLLEYFSFCIYSHSIHHCGMGIMLVICVVHKDADVVLSVSVMYAPLAVCFSMLPEQLCC
jgi:hypothetical protein